MKTKLHAFITAAIAIGFGSPAFASDLPKVDTSTPKGTVKGIFLLSFAGDFDGMKNLFVSPANDKEKELLAVGFSDDMYLPALSAAMLEKFPDAKITNPAQMLERAKAEIDKMNEKIEGDTATLTLPAPPAGKLQNSGQFQEPVIIKKVGDTWKMAITENPFIHLRPQYMRERHKAKCEFMVALIRDVKAGKYASPEELKKDMRQKEDELQKKFAPAPSANVGDNAPKPNFTQDTNLSEEDKKAKLLLDEADALIEQKKAAEAEAKILEIFPLKLKLSPKVRSQVSATIVRLGMLDASRAGKLGPQWDKL